MSRVNQIKDEYYAGLYDYKDLEKSLKNAKTAVRDLLAEITRLETLNKKAEGVIEIILEALKGSIVLSTKQSKLVEKAIADYRRDKRGSDGRIKVSRL